MEMKTAVSVIICTHNPRLEYLNRVLDALRAQSLPKSEWEFLLVDNASSQPLTGSIDLSWQPKGRIVLETELGLTPARLRGIDESAAELVVFVDDDNVLAPDYLEQAVGLAQRYPMIGAFGGSCRGQFEVEPPASIIPYLPGLVVEEIDRDHWANAYEWSKACPFGAGMCVRRPVALAYASHVRSNPLLRKLGRSGKQLLAGEDTDMAWTAVDLGMGTGRFRALQLTHLISKGRLTEDYVVRIFAGFRISKVILAAARNPASTELESPLREFITMVRACLRTRGVERRIRFAAWKGRREVRRLLADAGKAG